MLFSYCNCLGEGEIHENYQNRNFTLESTLYNYVIFNIYVRELNLNSRHPDNTVLIKRLKDIQIM